MIITIMNDIYTNIIHYFYFLTEILENDDLLLYHSIICLILISITIGYLIHNHISKINDEIRIKKILIVIQSYLYDKNTDIKFTTNQIYITGNFDTNFKIALYDYLNYYNIITSRNNIEKEINNLFIKSNIRVNDVIFLYNLTILADKQ